MASSRSRAREPNIGPARAWYAAAITFFTPIVIAAHPSPSGSRSSIWNVATCECQTMGRTLGLGGGHEEARPFVERAVVADRVMAGCSRPGCLRGVEGESDHGL